MFAHTPTMYLMVVAVSVALAVSVATLVTLSERKREGLLLWAAGLGFYALTYVLFGLRGSVSDFLSIVMTNTALSAALALVTQAMLVFQQREMPQPLFWLPVATAATMLTAFDNPTVRLITMAVLLGSQSTLLVTIVVQRLTETVGRGKYLVIVGMLIAIAIFVSRLLGVFVGLDQSVAVNHSNPIQTVTHVLGMVVLIFLTVGFVFMTKERADSLNVRLAMRDELTQLHNRRAILEALNQQLAVARRNQAPLSVLMLDVDHFKGLNDKFGHAGGDRVLREIASAVQGQLRAQDLAGRLGGEEFLILLPYSTAAAAAHTAERLRQAVHEIDCLQRCKLPTSISVSIGGAQFKALKHLDADSLVHEADQALYRAKASGRNRVVMVPALSVESGPTGFSTDVGT